MIRDREPEWNAEGRQHSAFQSVVFAILCVVFCSAFWWGLTKLGMWLFK